jgi:hypothetical protein
VGWLSRGMTGPLWKGGTCLEEDGQGRAGQGRAAKGIIKSGIRQKHFNCAQVAATALPILLKASPSLSTGPSWSQRTACFRSFLGSAAVRPYFLLVPVWTACPPKQADLRSLPVWGSPPMTTPSWAIMYVRPSMRCMREASKLSEKGRATPSCPIRAK